ncbi:hypothetical protein GCM10029978_074290 [Actinoallomurus acanthiterrae]
MGGYLVQIVVGMALALAVAPLLERLTGVGLLVVAVLLGLNRAVGLGLGTLLVFLVWRPDDTVVLWFAVPLLVIALLALLSSRLTAMFTEAFDTAEGTMPWGVLLLASSVGAVVWAIWSWSGWASAAVPAAVFVWGHWYRLTGTLPGPWRKQVQRRDCVRLAVIAYLVFSPLGGAAVAELSAFRPQWLLVVVLPLLALVAHLTYPTPHPAWPWLIPGGMRVRQVLVQGGLLAAFLALRYPDAPPALPVTSVVMAGAALATQWALGTAPINGVITQNLVQLSDVETILDDWAARAVVRRRPDARLLNALAGRALQSLNNRAPTAEALLNVALVAPGTVQARASDPFAAWLALVEQALSAVERCARAAGRDMDRVLALLRAHTAGAALAGALQRRDLGEARTVLAHRVEQFSRAGLRIQRDDNRLMEARLLFGCGDDVTALEIVESVLAEPDLDVFNRRDALVLSTLSAVIDGRTDAAHEHVRVSAGLRVTWADRRRLWREARAMKIVGGAGWMLVPVRVWRAFRSKQRALDSGFYTPEVVLEIFDTLGAMRGVEIP